MESPDAMGVVTNLEYTTMLDEILDLHAEIESAKRETLKDGAFRAGRVVAVNPDREIAMLTPLRTDDATGKQVPDYSGPPLIASTKTCPARIGEFAGAVRSAGRWFVACSESNLPCIAGDDR